MEDNNIEYLTSLIEDSKKVSKLNEKQSFLSFIQEIIEIYKVEEVEVKQIYDCYRYGRTVRETVIYISDKKLGYVK